ncbi:nucleoside triphosphate pyrophosphohydrolase [Desulfitobacterium sp. THU1]|uniref:nucleoside triphosphate pyrophosphohydrolase n=1 Tax=Desulfitobacterium sp. THU1 TaxID=3138072 RepID=UPI00311D75CA
MGNVLHVVGLGPAGLESMTLGDYRMIKQAKRVFFRTVNHPCAQDLLAEGLQVESFDDLYDQEESFEKVYEGIVKRLEKECNIYPEVVYAVPGHPTVAERSVQLLVNMLANQVEIQVHPALSFLDPLFSAIPMDPVEGFLLRNYDDLKESGLTGREWLVIPQVYDGLIASEVKLDLMEVYADEAEAYVVQALGTKLQKVLKCQLFELDHQTFDHLTTVVLPPHRAGISMTKLLEIMRTLRSPGGCPWDQEQTHTSLKPYLVEESYEVLEAIEAQDMYNLAEELGDLLLQVVFHAQVAQEAGEFQFQDVLRSIIEKMIRRHPHVFGDIEVENSTEVLKNWDQIKQKEKGEQGSEELFNFPKGLPSLMLAVKTQKKVAKLGFDWSDFEGPLAKVYEELQELEEAMGHGKGIEEEFGDTLFALVNLSRFLKLDPEDAVRKTVGKFQRRFLEMVKLAEDEGEKLPSLTLDQMDKYWEMAKKREKNEEIGNNP